jgi:hypothetical protein
MFEIVLQDRVVIFRTTLCDRLQITAAITSPLEGSFLVTFYCGPQFDCYFSARGLYLNFTLN